MTAGVTGWQLQQASLAHKGISQIERAPPLPLLGQDRIDGQTGRVATQTTTTTTSWKSSTLCRRTIRPVCTEASASGTGLALLCARQTQCQQGTVAVWARALRSQVVVRKGKGGERVTDRRVRQRARQVSAAGRTNRRKARLLQNSFLECKHSQNCIASTAEPATAPVRTALTQATA